MLKTSKNIAQQESRLALYLILPTLILLVLLIAYPVTLVLGQAMTDKVFATSKTKTSYIGMQNYQKLLSLTIQKLPYKLDQNGQKIFDPKTHTYTLENPNKILPRKPLRYKALKIFSFGGQNYVIGASDANFYRAWGDVSVFTIIALFFETVLGFLIALVLNQKFRGRGLLRAAMLVPWAIPTAVSSRMWQWIFNASRVGLANTVGYYTGLSDGQYPFLINPDSQLLCLIIIDVWKTTPFMALMILAALQGVPKTLYEAARVDGANVVKRFFVITLPTIMPVLTVALIFRTLDSLRVFDLFQIVYGQSRYSISSFIYYELISNKASGYSSAAGMILLMVLVLITFVYMKILRRSNQNA